MDKNEGQKTDNYSKKLGKLGGNAYENIISYNLSKKFFVEDITNKKEEKSFSFNTNKTIDINELKKEIIEKLMPGNELSVKENNERIEVIHDFLNQINGFYTHQSNYDKIYKLTNHRPELNQENIIQNNSIKTSSFSNTKNNKRNTILYKSGSELTNRTKITDTVSSDLFSSDSNQTFASKKSKKKIKSLQGEDNQKERHKNINEIEFDLVLKNISGKNLINFINEMQQNNRLYQYSSHTELKHNINYNVCVEITVQSSDIIKKKFPQLYKNISCLKFLQDFYEFLNKKKTFMQNPFSKTLEYLKNKTNFIDFKNEIVFITVSNGTIESFNQIITELEQRKKINDEAIKIFDAINNYNYYMIYYPPYDDKYTSPYDKTIKDLIKDNNDLKEKVKNLENIILELQKKYNNPHQTKEENKNKEEKNDTNPKEEIRKDEDEEEYDEEEEEEEDEIEEKKKGEIQYVHKNNIESIKKEEDKSKNKSNEIKSEITEQKEMNKINQSEEEEYDEEEEEEDDDEEEEAKKGDEIKDKK